ncbi:DUF2274 domain-containing protein [Agrobacterium vitis]|uniref:DUF2274 domain-containing protein n=1 Tax=Agrobacterium vitis TaxID=373 RepID=A0A368NVP4_AGRVI|nr:DUF2274 domain-containing protein [Agrobacterium vitis]KAA3528296.1 DUF2274 domain-containing protein [Agrobacterium vitis]MCM2449046.1 DUF2274 domain-containing protein [Agrobacterium vitis]MCM2467308.1 DUF2274 domain-containing protein [Agrobacterium vitis]MUO68787.1 DUF2274 domain-containing protein [Agrobacterium vitis]
MAKLKLGPLIEDKAVKISIEHPGPLYRDTTAYADYLNSRHVFVSLTGDDTCRN